MKEQLNAEFTKTDYGKFQILEVEYTRNEKRHLAYIAYHDGDYEKAKEKLTRFIER